MVERGKEREPITKFAASEEKLDCENGNIAYQWTCFFPSAFVGGMNAARFDNFPIQARTNLDPEVSISFK
mgnify:CR=1 FL=1